MTKADRHIFLYAKYHYKKTDIVKDVQKIMGKRSAIDPEYITINDIISVLLPIAYYFIQKNNHLFIDFILSLAPENRWKVGDPNNDFNTTLIAKCLSILRFQKVKNIPFELGEPDKTLLAINPNSRWLHKGNKT